jgi:hypothetical protein
VTCAGLGCRRAPLVCAAQNTERDGAAAARCFRQTRNRQGVHGRAKNVAADDADLLLAKNAEPVLRQVLTVTPGVQEFVKNITKKYLQR